MDLIKKLESATGPSRELDIWLEIELTSKWRRGVDDEYIVSELLKPYQQHPKYPCPQWTLQADAHETPRYTASIDAAVSLGQNIHEQKAILETIVSNFDPPTYTLERCILFGCATALKAHTAQEKGGES